LIEQYERGRSRLWFWRQVLMTLLVGSWNDIRDHQMLALRAAVTGFLLYLALSFPVSLVIRAVQTSITRWLVASGHATLWRIFWRPHATHGFFACTACALVGGIVARLYPSHRVGMVVSSSVALLLFEYSATSYGFLRYGSPPEPLLIVVLPVLFVMGRPL